jgi:glycosyltransferase involved in cell wall biosynthesis
MCAALVDALVARGHDVTVIGAGTRSGTRAQFVPTVTRPQHLRLGEGLPELLHVSRANLLIEDGGFDVVHDHTSAGLLSAASRSAPTVATVHGCPTGEVGHFLTCVGQSVALVAISSAQRRLRPDLRWAATVHNGLAMTPAAPLGRAGPAGRAGRSPDRSPVLWLARFSPDKGPDLAIKACRAAGLPLVLAGKCTEPSERSYLSEVIAPMLGSDVELVLNADRERCQGLLREARCLIMPIRWQEPFGMVMVEAMAAGIPVVALNRGAVPEIVRPGVSGLICAEPYELPDALRKVAAIDPEACAAYVRRSFSAEVMAGRYEEVYRAAIRATEPVPAPVLASVGGEVRG